MNNKKLFQIWIKNWTFGDILDWIAVVSRIGTVYKCVETDTDNEASIFRIGKNQEKYKSSTKKSKSLAKKCKLSSKKIQVIDQKTAKCKSLAKNCKLSAKNFVNN